MSKALLKKSMQIVDQSNSKPIFARDAEEDRKEKKRKPKKKAIQRPSEPTTNSKVEENVKKLLKLSNFKLNDKMVQSAFRRSSSRHYRLPEKEKEPEQQSVFTEEDFARFAAEYTG